MKKIKIELTAAQYSVVTSIIHDVQYKLKWDKYSQLYTDGGDILIALDKSEYRALMNIKTL